MANTPSTAAGTTAAVLALSKRAWKLGIALSKLEQDADVVDTATRILTEDVKSLVIDCDLVYSELETVLSNSETGPARLYDVDDRIWGCLDMQMEEASHTMQELELYIESYKETFQFISQAQREKKLSEIKLQIASIRSNVCRHAENLRTTLLLLNMTLTYLSPCRVDAQLAKELDKLQEMLETLHRTSGADSQIQPSRTEAVLIQYAREVIVKGTTMYEASVSPGSFSGSRGAEKSGICVAEWVRILDSIRQDQQAQAHDIAAYAPSASQEGKPIEATANDSDDDLETDLAKAALESGTKAFETQNWAEANSLLQEALQILQQLPKRQRAFCDIFSMHYKFSVCAYHTQEPVNAEIALMSLVQQPASSDEQRRCAYDAMHLLSQLYIRTGQFDRARIECEKALQYRRRLLGKQSDASFESIALMAHIYVLLNNRPRAKSYLTMIPESRRDSVLRNIEESLGTEVEHLDFSSLLTQSTVEDSLKPTRHHTSRLSGSTLGLAIEDMPYRPLSSVVKTPPPSIRLSHRRIPSSQPSVEDLRPISETSLSPPEAAEERRERTSPNEDCPTGMVASGLPSPEQVKYLDVSEIPSGKVLSRKEIIQNIGCPPRDKIEEAVCDGDQLTLARLLDKKKDFWRSRVRKRVRPERLTALHFSALFGEIDMARRLLDSSFDVNAVPYGYTTSLSPLKIAIGARQVDMVEFLIAKGAKPSEPDTWSTLAAQLMSRSWLVKTLSESKKEFVPNQMIAVLSILLRHGWDVNAPFESSGETILHQAVSFWTGSYRWDLNLRATITEFLCEQGANPLQANAEGKSPYDMVLASGHQELLMIFKRDSRKHELAGRLADPVELSG